MTYAGPTILLDVLLIGAGIVSAAIAWRELRGRISPGIVVGSLGLLLLGLVHLTETFMFEFTPSLGEVGIEMIHRSLVFAGFIWLMYGLFRVGRELRVEWERVLHAGAALIVAEEDLRLTSEELRERNQQLLAARSSLQRPPLRVAIALPDGSLRRVVRALLEGDADIEVVGESAGARIAEGPTAWASPEVILLDDSAGDASSIDELKVAFPSAEVIVLGTYPGGALAALVAGASDFVLKDDVHGRLPAMIRRVVLGSEQDLETRPEMARQAAEW